MGSCMRPILAIAALAIALSSAAFAQISGKVSARFETTSSYAQRSLRKQIFEFSEGGGANISRSGAWAVRLTSGGAFSIQHRARGKVKRYRTFSLTKKENSEFWELIRTLDIENMKSSTRPGVLDEVQYTFVLSDRTQAHSIELWMDDTHDNKKVTDLVDRIYFLIEKYSGKKP